MIVLEQDGVEITFGKWNFPGKEVGVKLPDSIKDVETWVTLWLPTSEDLIVFFNVLDALGHKGVSKSSISVRMPYVPYARQDRVCHPGESEALDVFCRMFTRMVCCREVVIDDPHSQATVEKLWSYNYELRINHQHVCARNLPRYDTLIAPDKGAHSKLLHHNQVHWDQGNCVFLEKERTATGVSYVDYKHDTIVGTACVVDDIGDGLATFISIGKMLRATQPRLNKLDLYLTHGLFSNLENVEKCKTMFNNIYVKNLFREELKNDNFVVTLQGNGGRLSNQ